MSIFAIESEENIQDSRVTDEQIESQLDRLSLESSYISNLIGIFKDVIPNTASRLKESASTFFSEPEYIEVSQSEVIKIKHITENSTMSNYSTVLVEVPEGFSGHMPSYINYLREELPKVTNDLSGLITEYNSMLAAFISDKATKVSLKDNTHIFKKSEQIRKSVSDGIKKYFKNPEHQSRNALSKVLNQLKEVHPLIKDTNKLAKEVQAMHLDQLKTKVNESTKLLDIIIEQVSKEGIDKVSGQAALNISKGAYEMARAVEFASMYYFRIQQALVSSRAITDKIKSIT